MILRHQVLAAMLSVFISANLFGQGKEDFTKKLSDIRLKYSKIDSYKSYVLVVIDDAESFLEHATDNGAQLTGYFKGDSLLKVVEEAGLSNRYVQNKYYLENDKLFFVYSNDSSYKFDDSTETFDYSKLIFTSGGKYYFEKGKLFHSILSNKDQQKTRDEDAVDFLASIRKYIILLKAKRKEDMQ